MLYSIKEIKQKFHWREFSITTSVHCNKGIYGSRAVTSSSDYSRVVSSASAVPFPLILPLLFCYELVLVLLYFNISCDTELATAKESVATEQWRAYLFSTYMYLFVVHLFSFLRHLFLPFRADSSNEAPVANGLTEFGEVSEFELYCLCCESYASVCLLGHC